MRSLTTLFAKSAYFETHHADLKSALSSHLSFQFLERRTCIFHNRAAAEASHVAVLTVRLGLVVVLLTLDVHQVQFVNQPASLKQRNRSIDGGAVDIRILFSGHLQ
jgi:hypothetical protein